MSTDFPFEHFLNQTNPLLPTMVNETIVEKSNVDNSLFSADELSSVSEEILSHLKQTISEQKFDAFFAHTFVIKNIKSDAIEASVSTEFIKKMITGHYQETIESIFNRILGKPYKLEINVLNREDKVEIKKEEPINLTQSFSNSTPTITKNKTVKDISFTINDLIPTQDDLIDEIQSKVIEHSEESYGQKIDKRKSFENFIVGPSNNMAHASAIAVAKDPGKVYPCLYLHGNSGLGKTHLLHAVANLILDMFPNKRIIITTANDFMAEMISYIQLKKIQEFRRKYSELVDVLIVDDIHELKNRPGTQNEFFHIFNELHSKGKQLIFTSDKHPKEITGIEERIKTRLSWGLVLDIQQPDLETRIAILKKKAEEEDIYLPDDVVNLIARSIKSNIRELEGSLIRLGAYSSVFKVDIDLEIAKEQLKLDENSEIKIHTLESIAKTVSQHFKIPVADLRSKARMKRNHDSSSYCNVSFIPRLKSNTCRHWAILWKQRSHHSYPCCR
jgi:chromosomal replication initiator protein